jgi:hypothetical protein
MQWNRLISMAFVGVALLAVEAFASGGDEKRE